MAKLGYDYFKDKCDACGYISPPEEEKHTCCPNCGAIVNPIFSPEGILLCDPSGIYPVEALGMKLPLPEAHKILDQTYVTESSKSAQEKIKKRLEETRAVYIPKDVANKYKKIIDTYVGWPSSACTINEEELKNISSPEKELFVEHLKTTKLLRPTFEQVYMRLARIFSLRSTCSRRKVGCVITSHDYRRVLSVGYNGNASGLPNECDAPESSGACGCLHAEENAVISCSESPYTKKVVFTTTFPCKMCAKRIIQLGGVIHVFYYEKYRNDDAKYILDERKINYSRVTLGAYGE